MSSQGKSSVRGKVVTFQHREVVGGCEYELKQLVSLKMAEHKPKRVGNEIVNKWRKV